MNVLSLFDGISCGQIALNRVGIKYENYYASEIDKKAISVTTDNYPETIQLGNVTEIKTRWLPKIDLLIGGSPCQGFSQAGNGLNFEHKGSKLYFEYLKLKNELSPEYFLLENVRMDKWCESIITDGLGVEPIGINSSLVSAQNRPRMFWTNIPFNKTIEDKGIFLRDVVDVNANRHWIDPSWIRNKRQTKNYLQYDPNNTGHCGQAHRAYYLDSKIGCLHTKSGTDHKVLIGDSVGRITRNEAERLQTVPENYTRELPTIQAINALGNGWTVDVIAHIFKSLA